MRSKHNTLALGTALTIVASLSLLLTLPAPASADNECRLDQRQLQNPGAIAFGGKTVLAQTFIPSVPGHRVCRIKITISKNAAAAGNLTLHVVNAAFGELDAGVTIPGAAIPMGNSVQLFDFGCNGAPLGPMAFYGLKLESLDGPAGAYSWKGSAANLYVKPGNGGRGWRSFTSGNGNWTSLGGWDYAFEIYMCD